MILDKETFRERMVQEQEKKKRIEIKELKRADENFRQELINFLVNTISPSPKAIKGGIELKSGNDTFLLKITKKSKRVE